MMTWRGLQNAMNGKGMVDVWIAELEFKEMLFNKVVPFLISKLKSLDIVFQRFCSQKSWNYYLRTFSTWDTDIVTKMKDVAALHNVFREF
jgi:hypothetical protein